MLEQLPVDTLLNNGRYIIKALYRKGGQCLVYSAYDLRDNQQVIIKQPEQTWAQEALQQEADLLASLDHPSLPRVVDRFEERGSTFLVTTYIPGTDLDELLRKHGGPFTINEVVGWAEQLLDILEYLQGQETVIVHRDINPRNIRLTPDNLLFLLDFGVAKKINKKTLLIGGTPHYAPPEQLRDEGTDYRSDIYSFAATLYYLLTATEPADSLSRSTALIKGLPDPLLPASDRNKEVPVYLCRLLTEAMSLEREYRPSAAIFRHRLRTKSQMTEECETETVTSPRNDGDPEVTAVRAKEVERLRGSNRVVVTLGKTQLDPATQMAQRLFNELRDSDAIHHDVIQIIIELMDAKPESRQAILKRYRSILNSHKRSDPPLAFSFIDSLAKNSIPAPDISAQLREALGKVLAKSPSANLSVSDQEKNSSRLVTEDLISPERVHRIESHRQWLRQLLIWVARGVLIALGVKLILLLISGKFTLIQNLPLANFILVAYTVIILVLVRQISQLDIDEKKKYSLPCNLAGLFYGFILVDVIIYDVLVLISK